MNVFRDRIKQAAAGVLLATLTISTGAGMASAQPWRGNPPPPRHETWSHRPGYAWENGHWRRVGARWVWVNGHEVALGHGGRWVAGHWVNGPRGRYWVGGHRI